MKTPIINTAVVASEPIAPAKLYTDLLAMLPAGDYGAAASFTGSVRDLTGNLKSLTLEHYPGMTEKTLNEIAQTAAERFNADAILIRHRSGKMLPGDPIVFVGALSPHRQAAFDATQFIMDFLKNDAPFWKKEAFEDGSSEWVAAKDSDKKAQDRWS